MKEMSGLMNCPSLFVLAVIGVCVLGGAVEGAYTVLGDDDNTCLYASFDVNLYIYRNETNNSSKENSINGFSIETHSFKVPKSTDKSVAVTGECNNNGLYSLMVDWQNKTHNFTLSMDFLISNNSSWALNKIIFQFSDDYFDHELASNGEDVLRTFVTEEQTFFERIFHKNEYFYCDGCKQYTFSNSSGACVGSKCSYLTLERSRIYLGDFENGDPKKKLCKEDYISQREIIVPIAVGGFLIFLVTILILAYIGAFIKRKVKERTVNYTRM